MKGFVILYVKRVEFALNKKAMDNIEIEFTKIIEQHKKTIYTICYFFSKDSDEVNDLFQEILINLWNGYKSFRGESNVKTWIWRVSLNTCNTQERKKKRQVQTIPLTMDIDLYNDTDVKSKQIQMLYDRINRLEVFDRAIILLWLENMSYQDIANVMGLTVSNITTRLFRIKEQLKSMSNN